VQYHAYISVALNYECTNIAQYQRNLYKATIIPR